VEVNDIVALAAKDRSEAHRARNVDRIAQLQRIAGYSSPARPFAKAAVGITNQFRAMAHLQQLARESKHLRLAAREAAFRIDARDAQGLAGSTVANRPGA